MEKDNNPDYFRLSSTPGALLKFEEKLTNYLYKKYGNLGVAIIKGDDFVFQMPIPPSDTKSKVEMEEYRELKRKYNTRIQDYNDNKPKAFGDIRDRLDDIPLSRVKTHAEYQMILNDCDPISLWRIIKERHNLEGGELRAARLREEKALDNMKQHPNEDIEVFAQRYEDQLFRIKAAKINLDDESMVRKYLKALDENRFDQFVLHLFRNRIEVTNFDMVRSLSIEWEKTAEAIMKPATQKLVTDVMMTNSSRKFVRKIPRWSNKAGSTTQNADTSKADKNWLHKRVPTEMWQTFSAEQKKLLFKLRSENKGEISNFSVNKKRILDGNNESEKIASNNGSGFLLYDDDDNEQENVTTRINEAFMIKSGKRDRNVYCLDSGATINVVNDKDSLKNIRSAKRHISTALGVMSCQKIGDHPIFGECLLVPNCPINLISLSKARKRFWVNFDDESDCFTLKNDSNMFKFKNVNDMYELYSTMANELTNEEKLKSSMARKLHLALCHPYDGYLKRSLNQGYFSRWGVKSTDVDLSNIALGHCTGCLQAKMSSSISNEDDIHTPLALPGEHIHIDILYIDKKPYLLGECERTGYLMIIELSSKSKQSIISGINSMKNGLKTVGLTLKCIHSDREPSLGGNGNPFSMFKSQINELEIQLIQTSSGEHERYIERSIRSLRNRIRATILGLPYRLPKSLLKFAVSSVVLAMNEIPNNKTKNISPREIITKYKENGKYIRGYFGMIGLFFNANLPSHEKLLPRSDWGILVGRDLCSGGVKVFLFESRSIVVRKRFAEISPKMDNIAIINAIADKEPEIIIHNDISFDEPIVPISPSLNVNELNKKNENYSDQNINSLYDDIIKIEKPSLHQEFLNDLNDNVIRMGSGSIQNNGTGDAKDIDTGSINKNSAGSTNDNDTGVVDNNGAGSAENKNIDIDNELANNYIGNKVRYTLRSRPKVDYSKLHHGNFVDDILIYVYMMEFAGVMKYEKVNTNDYKNAINYEIKQMIEKEVFQVVDPKNIPNDEKIIPSRIFVEPRYDANGDLLKIKARLVAGGHRQDDSFGDLFSPTAKFESIMLVLNIATFEDREIEILDIAGAYLNANIYGHDTHNEDKVNDNILMWLDEESTKSYLIFKPECLKFVQNKRLLVRIEKALYGLKQSAKRWYEELTRTLVSFGFIKSKFDGGVLYREGGKCIIVLHVDDLFVTGTKQDIEIVKESLKLKYKKVTSKQGDEIGYLGMWLVRKRNEKKMFISQPKHIKQLISEFPNVYEYETPASPNMPQTFDDVNIEMLNDENKTFYRSCLMKAMYIARSRPDIKFILILLATKMEEPNVADMKQLERVIGYLKKTENLVLTIKPMHMRLQASADASYAIHHDAKSHTGVVMTLGTSPVKSNSIKQKLVVKSSTEAELVALNSVVEDVIWAKGIMEELGYPQPTVNIFQDNKSCITMANRGTANSKRSKHINVRYFFLSQHIQDKTIKLVHIGSKMIDSDGLTKVKAKADFILWRVNILNIQNN